MKRAADRPLANVGLAWNFAHSMIGLYHVIASVTFKTCALVNFSVPCKKRVTHYIIIRHDFFQSCAVSEPLR